MNLPQVQKSEPTLPPLFLQYITNGELVKGTFGAATCSFPNLQRSFYFSLAQ